MYYGREETGPEQLTSLNMSDKIPSLTFDDLVAEDAADKVDRFVIDSIAQEASKQGNEVGGDSSITTPSATITTPSATRSPSPIPYTTPAGTRSPSPTPSTSSMDRRSKSIGECGGREIRQMEAEITPPRPSDVRGFMKNFIPRKGILAGATRLPGRPANQIMSEEEQRRLTASFEIHEQRVNSTLLQPTSSLKRSLPVQFKEPLYVPPAYLKQTRICAEAGMTLQAEHDRKMKLILPKEELKKSKKVYIFQNLFFKRPYWVNLHPHFPGEAAFDARLEKFLAAGPIAWFVNSTRFGGETLQHVKEARGFLLEMIVLLAEHGRPCLAVEEESAYIGRLQRFCEASPVLNAFLTGDVSE